MRKLAVVGVLALCVGAMLAGVVELGLIADANARGKICPAAEPEEPGTCDPAGPAVFCRGCIYESISCAVAAGWDPRACHPLRRKATPQLP